MGSLSMLEANVYVLYRGEQVCQLQLCLLASTGPSVILSCKDHMLFSHTVQTHLVIVIIVIRLFQRASLRTKMPKILQSNALRARLFAEDPLLRRPSLTILKATIQLSHPIRYPSICQDLHPMEFVC